MRAGKTRWMSGEVWGGGCAEPIQLHPTRVQPWFVVECLTFIPGPIQIRACISRFSGHTTDNNPDFGGLGARFVEMTINDF